jgi:hypothetical protein
MIFKFFIALLLFCSQHVFAAECTLYEKSHPLWPLSGAHLSTGKCQTCASCHKQGVFIGTPRSCVTCHNGDPKWMTVGRSAKHIPTQLVECSFCHNVIVFNNATMNHTSVAALRCDSCHNGAYTAYNADGKPKDHPTSRTVNGVKIIVNTVDCNHSGCHRGTTSFSM